MQAYHNSHDLFYRRPFGAAEICSQVELSLDADAAGAQVRLWRDGVGETLIPMEKDGVRFRAVVSVPAEPGLLWYYFILTDADGRRYYYGNAADGLGGEGVLTEGEPPSYQITVYRPAPVPAWYKDALVYQIFPDRFARGADWRARVEAAARPADRVGVRRVISEDWDDEPFYTRDKTGAVSRWQFFGGTLSGVREKLPYLRAMGVTAIYLNPIFRAASNHRYDTADYLKIDPMLGDEETFRDFCAAAAAEGISVILDGVFSHTGADSIYFDKYGNFGGHGAFSDENSPYRGWYRFTPGREPGYECWWGVTDLPNVEELAPGYQELICGEHGVLRRWLSAGASGWRLDVADELPDAFIREVRSAIRAEKPDGLLLGEVWEDASNKRSYGEARQYLMGEELDSTMNYPFRDMMLDFLMGRADAPALCRRMTSLMENYPKENFYGALNLVGGHDRMRILTYLGGAPEDLPDGERAEYRLAPHPKYVAVQRLKLLSVLQYASPGVPCLYYGDEAGLEGYPDPYNRGTYPWGRENGELLHHYRMLGLLYREHRVLKDGGFRPFAEGADVYGFWRENDASRILVLANRSAEESRSVTAEVPGAGWALELLTSKEQRIEDGKLTLTLKPFQAMVILLASDPPERVPLPRGAGVLCHISSLPGEGKSGTMGRHAREFVDFLQRAGMKLWQILPLNPVGLGDSPYLSPAVFAGNRDLIDPDELPDLSGLDAFCEKNRYWLEDYVLYTALKEHFDGAAWQDWPADARDRTDLPKYEALLAPRLAELRAEQYAFFTQWDALHAYAASRGISIVGDLPIYAAPDGADTWAHPEVFQLDAHGRLRARAGVPPDYFTPDGQDWGNPLYDWDALRRDGYGWWIERLRGAAERYDTVRIDHFRSFSAYYSIPAGVSAKEGAWHPGEGLRFFRAAREALGDLRVIAEDLGMLDADVYNLIKRTGFPGMQVWQFSRKEMLEMTKEEQSVRIFYSGTHDNQTLVGWCAAEYPGEDPVQKAVEAVRTLYRSFAPWVVVQLQDMLYLGDEARLNVPGTPEGNWHWRVRGELLTDEIAERFRRLAGETNR